MESILKTEAEAKVLALCEKFLAPHGFRAVDVDCHLAGRAMIRVFVEREGAVTSVEDCAKVSELLGPIVEKEEVIQGSYDLEVSSPGLDRRLRLSSDFEKAVGREIKLRCVEKIEGLGANLSGQLKEIQGEVVTLSMSDGRTVNVPLTKIKRANLVWR